jgi:hypothetical protein
MGSGMPAWNQVGCAVGTSCAAGDIVVGNYEQALFWHEVGSTVSENEGTFTFTYWTSVRGACAGVTYTNTCLMSGTPCSDPIFDFSSGTASLNQAVTQTGTSNMGATSGEIDVPALGEIVAFYGTSDTFSQFGEDANTLCNNNGGTCPDSNGLFNGCMTGPITGRSGVNGGIDVAAKGFSSATDGPFLSTLPDRVDPTGGFAVSTITGSGSTASGTTTSTNIGYIGSLNAYISGNTGGTPPGGFNTTPGGGNVVNITSDGNQDFSYANTTTGSGSGGSIFLQDPAVGNNVSQVVSIISETP